MKRRDFLVGSASLPISLAGCDGGSSSGIIYAIKTIATSVVFDVAANLAVTAFKEIFISAAQADEIRYEAQQVGANPEMCLACAKSVGHDHMVHALKSDIKLWFGENRTSSTVNDSFYDIRNNTSEIIRGTLIFGIVDEASNSTDISFQVPGFAVDPKGTITDGKINIRDRIMSPGYKEIRVLDAPDGVTVEKVAKTLILPSAISG